MRSQVISSPEYLRGAYSQVGIDGRAKEKYGSILAIGNTVTGETQEIRFGICRQILNWY
jgi:hypothetical protein